MVVDGRAVDGSGWPSPDSPGPPGPVYRGGSRSPLYVTAAGVGAEEAAGWVASMEGPYRVPLTAQAG